MDEFWGCLQFAGSSQQWQRPVDQRVVPPGHCTTYGAAYGGGGPGLGFGNPGAVG